MTDATLDYLLETRESATTDEEDVRRVNRQELLLWVLTPTFRWNRRDRPLDELQECLLNTLTRNSRVIEGLSDFREILSISSIDDLSAQRLGRVRAPSRLTIMFSTSSPTYPASVSVVASTMQRAR